LQGNNVSEFRPDILERRGQWRTDDDGQLLEGDNGPITPVPAAIGIG
jgi:hypothetical protein